MGDSYKESELKISKKAKAYMRSWSVKAKIRDIGIRKQCHEDEGSIAAALVELRGIMLESSSAEIKKRKVKK